MARSDGTVDAAELAALDVLRQGPAALGAETKVLERRPLRMALWASDFPGDVEAAMADREVEQVRTVERSVARRLARSNLVTIDEGGTVTLHEQLR